MLRGGGPCTRLLSVLLIIESFRLEEILKIESCWDGAGSTGQDVVVPRLGDAECILLLYLFCCACSKADVPLLAESVRRATPARR